MVCATVKFRGGLLRGLECDFKALELCRLRSVAWHPRHWAGKLSCCFGRVSMKTHAETTWIRARIMSCHCQETQTQALGQWGTTFALAAI